MTLATLILEHGGAKQTLAAKAAPAGEMSHSPEDETSVGKFAALLVSEQQKATATNPTKADGKNAKTPGDKLVQKRKGSAQVSNSANPKQHCPASTIAVAKTKSPLLAEPKPNAPGKWNTQAASKAGSAANIATCQKTASLPSSQCSSPRRDLKALSKSSGANHRCTSTAPEQVPNRGDGQIQSPSDIQIKAPVDSQIKNSDNHRTDGRIETPIDDQLDDQIDGPIEDKIDGPIHGQFDDQFDGQFDDQIDGPIEDQINKSINLPVKSPNNYPIKSSSHNRLKQKFESVGHSGLKPKDTRQGPSEPTGERSAHLDCAASYPRSSVALSGDTHKRSQAPGDCVDINASAELLPALSHKSALPPSTRPQPAHNRCAEQSCNSPIERNPEASVPVIPQNSQRSIEVPVQAPSKTSGAFPSSSAPAPLALNLEDSRDIPPPETSPRKTANAVDTAKVEQSEQRREPQINPGAQALHARPNLAKADTEVSTITPLEVELSTEASEKHLSLATTDLEASDFSQEGSAFAAKNSGAPLFISKVRPNEGTPTRKAGPKTDAPEVVTNPRVNHSSAAIAPLRAAKALQDLSNAKEPTGTESPPPRAPSAKVANDPTLQETSAGEKLTKNEQLRDLPAPEKPRKNEALQNLAPPEPPAGAVSNSSLASSEETPTTASGVSTRESSTESTFGRLGKHQAPQSSANPSAQDASHPRPQRLSPSTATSGRQPLDHSVYPQSQAPAIDHDAPLEHPHSAKKSVELGPNRSEVPRVESPSTSTSPSPKTSSAANSESSSPLPPPKDPLLTTTNSGHGAPDRKTPNPHLLRSGAASFISDTEQPSTGKNIRSRPSPPSPSSPAPAQPSSSLTTNAGPPSTQPDAYGSHLRAKSAKISGEIADGISKTDGPFTAMTDGPPPPRLRNLAPKANRREASAITAPTAPKAPPDGKASQRSETSSNSPEIAPPSGDLGGTLDNPSADSQSEHSAPSSLNPSTALPRAQASSAAEALQYLDRERFDQRVRDILQREMQQGVTPNDLSWEDPEFGRLHLNIDRSSTGLELRILAEQDRTLELLTQIRSQLADELSLNRDSLHISSGSREASSSSPFSPDQQQDMREQHQSRQSSQRRSEPGSSSKFQRNRSASPDPKANEPAPPPQSWSGSGTRRVDYLV